MDSIIYIGLDVHKTTVSVAVAEGGRSGEIRQMGVFENRADVLTKDGGAAGPPWASPELLL